MRGILANWSRSRRRSHTGIVRRLRRFWGDTRGAISPVLVMGLVPLIGALAMGVEASNWWLTQRSIQNAADSAAIAAAMNGSANGTSGGTACSTTDDWCSEARAISATYGFTNGSNNVVVTPTDNVACPSPLTVSDCFKVVITKEVPVRLLNIVGFQGDTVIGGQHFVTVKASAMAYATGGVSPPFCIVALGTSAKKDLVVNGGPNSDLPNCSVGSNGDVTCNGHPIDGTIASYAAGGDTNDCAANGNNVTEKTLITDPYTAQANDIPKNTCPNPSLASSYPQEAKLKKGQTANWNLISGTPAWDKTTQVMCGDVQLTGDVSLNAGTILVIENGALDLNGHNFTLNGGTVIFTGPTISGFSPSHFPEGGGALDITAPSGTWSGDTNSWTGFAVYQDPNLPAGAGIDITSAGNTPVYEINGLIYTPNANITISGDIGSAGACVGFLALTVDINGTGNVINSNTCNPINLSGEAFLQGRVALVQ